jgi:hypothetical protein
MALIVHLVIQAPKLALDLFLKIADGQVHLLKQEWHRLVLQSLSCQLRALQEHAEHIN